MKIRFQARYALTRLVVPPAVGVPAVGVPAVGVPAVGVPAVGVPAVHTARIDNRIERETLKRSLRMP
jgi:hypothetical protein